MGLLDRWAKKKADEQLASESKPETSPKTEAASAAKTKKTVSAKKTSSKKKEEATAEKPAVSLKGSMYRVLIAPVVSEKTARCEQENIYTFLVDRHATKQHVKQAIKELYGVTPSQVMMLNVPGKQVRFGRFEGRRSDYRKAMVKIAKGTSLAIHEGV
jgi:large subunit ribosomal protein L23